MKAPTRRDLAAEEARHRILAAAADCLVRDGLAQVRMAGIAKAAGVSSGLLHYHFDTKEQLFAELLTWSSAKSADLTQRGLDQAGDQPAQQLSAFLDRCLPSDEMLAHDWLLWQELTLLCMRHRELGKVGAELYDSLYSTAAQIITDGVASGVFDLPDDQVRMAAETAVTLCDGLGGRILTATPDLSLDEAREVVALAIGRVVGHRGPLPQLGRALEGSRT